eukprot:5506139-Prymnesium_polylepis.1
MPPARGGVALLSCCSSAFILRLSSQSRSIFSRCVLARSRSVHTRSRSASDFASAASDSSRLSSSFSLSATSGPNARFGRGMREAAAVMVCRGVAVRWRPSSGKRAFVGRRSAPDRHSQSRASVCSSRGVEVGDEKESFFATDYPWVCRVVGVVLADPERIFPQRSSLHHRTSHHGAIRLAERAAARRFAARVRLRVRGARRGTDGCPRRHPLRAHAAEAAAENSVVRLPQPVWPGADSGGSAAGGGAADAAQGALLRLG